MKFSGIVVIAYSLVVVLGGLIGYLTADSLPSLIAGSACGALLFASGNGLLRNSVVAYFTGVSMTLLLTIFFALRYYNTLKVMPSGVMAITSGVILILLLTTKGQQKV